MELKEYEKMYEFEEKYWWWIGKRDLVNTILGQLHGSFDKILDAGCGTGFNLNYLKNKGTVIGLDFSKDALKFCRIREHKDLIQADAEILPLKNDAIDIMIALDCLEHLDDVKCLKEFYRVLKPNGYLIITVPAFMCLWSKHDEALHHKRRYDKLQLINVLQFNGFIIKKISYWNFFLFLPVAALRLIKKSGKNQKIETDVKEMPKIINKILRSILRLEAYLISRLNLPIGVSMVCVGKANKPSNFHHR